MNKIIETKAYNIIQNRRLQAKREYQEKLKPLYADAEFVKLDKALTDLKIQNARKMAYGQNADLQQEQTLQKQLQDYKAKKGFKDVSVNFSCTKCQDQAYTNGQMCECLKKEYCKILFKESGFEKLENFDDAKKTCGSLAPVYQLMEKWCNSDFKKDLIYIAGPTGVGKTYLISCMANELINRGKYCQITTAFALNQDLKAFSKIQYEELLNKYTSIEVLFIDDLGTEPQYKNITNELLYCIINERKMKKLPTVITSNLDMNDLKETYGERIFSRIANRETSINIFIDGEDKRLKK